ncbi:hypothetical protein [Streptomyces sp. NPDC005017]|uniref:hypothetical protein n=1 Tax=Streptomyces sp. NPDC005017 TaxID=3364706 RepID=UPI0036776F30
MQQTSGEDEAAPAFDAVQADVGKRLDDVAKILAGALVTVAGVMTALGLTSDLVFVALNNESWPIYVASLCAILAIVCSIVALLIHPTGRGNVWKTAVLVVGVILYMVALSVSVVGAAKAAGGNGRPTIGDVRLEGPRSGLRLSFGVQADGVETWAKVGVYVDAIDEKGNPLEGSPDLYESSMRPDDRGRIKQDVSVPISAPPGAWGLEIVASNAGGTDDCDAPAVHGAACTTIQLP